MHAAYIIYIVKGRCIFFSSTVAEMGRHNLECSRPGRDDIILNSKKIRKGGSFMATVSETYSYRCEQGYIITAVLAEDQWDDDTGGNPELVSGGVDQRHVEIKVTSQWSRGFHFKFIVYGKRQ